MHDVAVGSRAGRRATRGNVLDDKLTFLRQETRRLGFPTHDGVHNGSVPRAQSSTRTRSAWTARSTRAPASPASSRCRPDTSTTAAIRGGVGLRTVHPTQSVERVWRLPLTSQCVPGCVAASYSQLGDMNTPTCLPSGASIRQLVSLAHTAASAS